MEFPPGFFDRADPASDAEFYVPPRLVTHIDAGAIAAVGALYAELGVDGVVLDLMGSWVSHFRAAPRRLTVLGMNEEELARNPQATATVVHDLNVDPRLPFAAAAFDDAVCCVSVDYLVEPVAVFAEVARVLRPGGRFVCTFSNRCFPTKAIRGWLAATDDERCGIVAEYFRRAPSPSGGPAGAWEDPVIERRVPSAGPGSPVDGAGAGGVRGGAAGDPLYAVWSRSVHSTT